uniref:Uncharacterized protein n=1 Tax=Magallana gigas TaxID=29159 RepID=K1QAU7_MAGGI
MVLQLRRKEELNISGFYFKDKSNVVLYGIAYFMHPAWITKESILLCAIVNKAEELTVLIQDVDTVIAKVCCQDPALAVCADTQWTKRSLDTRRMTRI